MKYKHLATIFFALLLGFLLLLVVSAVPQDPHAFYGDVTIGGTNAPSGSIITAIIGGTARGSITTTVAGSYGGATAAQEKLVVTRCESDESCYSAAQTISFNISASGCSPESTPTASFVAGKIEEKTLGFSGNCGASTGAGPTTSGGGGGGGGAGGGAAGPRVGQTWDCPINGCTITMRLKDKVKIPLKGVDHFFSLDEITRDYIVGIWTSTPKTIQVSPKQTVATDTDDNGQNDVSVTLDSIAGTLKQATIIFKPIQEEAPPVEEEPPVEKPPVEKPPKKPITGWIIIAVIVIIGLIGYYIYYRRARRD